MNKRLSPFLAIGISLLLATVVTAQVSYPNPVFTSYTIANLGTAPADIQVDYYNAAGVTTAGQNRLFSQVPVGGSVTVQQATENTLGSGVWSAVVSSGQPIAAVVNQQLGVSGSGSSIPPFSSYNGLSQGATTVVVPAMMHNWFGYNTKIFVQNAGTGPTNVTVTYAPTTLNGCVTGATGQTDTFNSLAQYAAHEFDQETKATLGGPGGGSCGSFLGRFLGSATITSSGGVPIVAIVNEEVQNKLFTYDGFNSGGTTLLAPGYMRNYFGFYASLTLANPGIATTANVTVTYHSDASFSIPTNTTVVAHHTIPAGQSITIYDGPGSTAPVSDLATTFNSAIGQRFFGSVKIQSDIPVMGVVNQESTAAAGNKAGSYNVMSSVTDAGSKLAVPLIQSAFYGYYTSLTIETVDGTDASLNICYTSDATFSSVKNLTKCYAKTTSGGFLNRYEGPSATAAQADLLFDPVWLSGGNRRFIGAATITVTSGPKIVAYVNEEASGLTVDAQYAYNAFVVTP